MGTRHMHATSTTPCTLSSRSSSPDGILRTPSTISSRNSSSDTASRTPYTLSSGNFSSGVAVGLAKQRLNQERDDAVAAREKSRREGKLISATENLLLWGVVAPFPRFPWIRAGLVSQPDRAFSVGLEQYSVIRALLLVFEFCLIAVISAVFTGVLVIFGASEVKGKPQSWGEEVLIFLGLARRPIHIEYVWGFTNLCIQLGFEILYYHIRILGVKGRRDIAQERHDKETTDLEQAKLDEIISLNTACRFVAHGLVGFITLVLNSALGAISRGVEVLYLTTFLFILMLRISNLIVDDIITQKHRAGGWINWFRSFIIPNRRYYTWAGLEENVNRIQLDPMYQELMCPLTQSLVVDPVRSTLSGQVYERHAVMRWVRESGTDPILRGERVTALDYIPAPVAKEYAQYVAQSLGAKLVLSEPEFVSFASDRS
ncbi:hypothetical protein EYR41_009963 [Orbilia oligospora]|uniref:peptidylprolyl isomerase n=1 Tax=Orbilia oligospora TaxID=2813651 RepID=A0A7C8KEG1_ORBOL|nr:hypothetical protein TWF751_005487 [Orbilia oligospora]TGJ63873.1 hypothetical protein EYR41_009963 [Orbilia oligospora]